MKMNFKLLALTMLIAIGAASCNQKPAEEGETNVPATGEAVSYTVNADQSVVNWKGDMLGMYFHSGDVKISQGSLTTTGGMVTGGNFTVNMNSIVATDDESHYKTAPREKLIEHLMSDDFFSVANNPTATFTVKSAEGNTLKGDLTLRGVTGEETVTDVVVTETDGKINATGKLVFDRKKYGANFEMTAANMVLSKDIELLITLNGVKQ